MGERERREKKEVSDARERRGVSALRECEKGCVVFEREGNKCGEIER